MEKVTIKELFKHYCFSQCLNSYDTKRYPQYKGLNYLRQDCIFTDPNTAEEKYWHCDVIIYPNNKGRYRLKYSNLDILVPKMGWKMIVKECFNCVMVYVRYKGEDGKYVWKQYRYTDDCEGTEEERVKAFWEAQKYIRTPSNFTRKVELYYNRGVRL